MTRIREANKQYNIHIVHITYLSPLLKFGKRKVFTVRKLVSCDVDKVRGITIFVRKKVGGIDPTHPPPGSAPMHPVMTARRWSNACKAKIQVDQPFLVSQYNKFMGGVDRFDQNIAQYRIHIRCRKWYWR